MAVLLADGFETWTEAGGSFGPWSTVSAGSGTYWSCDGNGTFTTDSSAQTAYLVYGLALTTTIIVNLKIAFSRNNATSSSYFIELYGGASHLHLAVNQGGCLVVLRDGTILGSTGQAVRFDDSYHDIEFKATINDTTGAYEVRVDGVNVLSASGVDTRNAGNLGVESVRIGQTNSASYCCDLTIDHAIIMDTSGSYMNDFIGPVKIETLFPTANGNYTDWTPNTGNAWDALNDVPPDNATTYISAASVADQSTFVIEDLAANTDTVLAVGVQSVIQKDDAAFREVSPLLRSTSTDYNGTTVAVPASFGTIVEWFDQSPFTTGDWTPSEVNGLEVGIEVET